MNRLAISIFAASLLSALVAFAEEKEQPLEAARYASIPAREHGYNNLETQVISNQAAYEALIGQVNGQDGWNNRGAFLKGLTDAEIDFATEALVLIRNTQTSGSITVASNQLSLEDSTLIMKIDVGNGGGFGTMDMAYYCFALVVKKDRVNQVSVETYSPPGVLNGRPESIEIE